MSESAIRAGLIRLAHAHPEFRKDLLPLIQRQAADFPADSIGDVHPGGSAEGVKGKPDGTVSDADKPWMKGEFTQQEFVEMLDEQESGGFGDGKVQESPNKYASDKVLRERLIRLAHSNPEFRADLLPLIKSACGSEGPMLARFEEGVPADPTENMSEEDAKTWWAEHAKNKDNFKGATNKTAAMAVVRRTIAIAVRILSSKPDITPRGVPSGLMVAGQMSIDFGGEIQPDAVRFTAGLAPGGKSYQVVWFTPTKTVSGAGADLILGVLEAALQEALDVKGATLLGPPEPPL